MATTTTVPARRIPVAVAAAAMGVMLVAGCASPTGTGDPAATPLSLVSTAAGLDAAPAAAAGKLAWPGLGGWVLQGSLPSEPTRADVLRWTSGAADAEDLAALAAAFGLDAGSTAPRAHGAVIAGAAGTLTVRDGDGSAWAFVRADRVQCPPFAVDVDDAAGGDGVVCAVAQGDSTQGRSKSPSDAEARALAAPVLAAAGIGATDAAAATIGTDGSGPGSVAVTVSPTVAGLPTSGLDTVVVVDADGVVAATGRLEVPDSATPYPLQTAAAAFDELRGAPVPAIGMPCDNAPAPATPEPGTPEPATPEPATPAPRPDGSGTPVAPDPCGSPEPTVVTGARLGLLLTAEQRGSGTGWLLAPAWFFRLDEGTELPVLALAPSALAPVTPEPVDPGTGAGGEPGSGGAVEPGTPGPASGPGAGLDPGTSGRSGSGGAGVDPGLAPEPVPSGPAGEESGSTVDATTPPQPKP